MDLGWTDPAAASLAEPIPDGRSFQALAAEALRNRVFVCAGLVERDRDQVFNTAVLISPTGELLMRHRKINELGIAWDYYAQGGSIEVCRTEIGVVGLMVCADGFAKEHYIGRALGHLGAEIILAPSSWAVRAEHDQQAEPYGQLWRDSFGPIAREFSTWVLAVSNVGPLNDGPWKGRKCIGCSLAFDAEGREVIYGSYGEDELLYVEPLIKQKPRYFNEAV
ncbi:MAG TPA: carbon-nitrogen hydrolase family protein, partial [Spirochaetia bacterium]|nr:carbon-nitrogen hydrolase family protein [Spirochaetia bacterium]